MQILLDQPVLVEIIKLTLNHGVYVTRAVTVATEFIDAVSTWQPHIAIVDMDLDGVQVVSMLGAKLVGGMRLPVIGLTRRGDLKTKVGRLRIGGGRHPDRRVCARRIVSAGHRACAAGV